MTDYTRIAQMIEEGHQGTSFTGQDPKPGLVLDERTRAITPEIDFNPLIGLTNEINTNFLTIKAPLTIESHSLIDCDHAIIKWNNLASGEKGCNELNVTESETETLLSWIVPVEALTKAGEVRISISIYDEDQNQNTTFRWNSLPYNGLIVEQGMDEVSVGPIVDNSIIDIDLYTRKITIPEGLNTQVGLVGEANINTLKFRCDRYYLGLDFSDTKYRFDILYNTPGYGNGWQSIPTRRVIQGTPEGPSLGSYSDLIEFEYLIPHCWTKRAGTISFAIQIVDTTENESRLWRSETNHSLSIGNTLDFNEEEDTNTIVIKYGEYIAGEGIGIHNATLALDDEVVYVFNAGDASEFITE